MALIQCPNCGEQVSDKSVKCVHCGQVLKEEPPKKIICKECGAELEEGIKACTKCGCPVELEKMEEAPQKVEVTNLKLNIDKNKRKLLIAIVAVIIVVVIGGIFIKKNYEQRKADDYASNIQTITTSMLSEASTAESAGNLIKQVWANAIYEDRDSETDEYTRPDGYFVDFNTALANLFADSTFQSTIEGLESGQDEIKTLMKEMQNPPSEYEDDYEALKEMYDAYNDFVNLVIDPSGSLQTFSSNFNDADSEMLKTYNAMEMYLE